MVYRIFILLPLLLAGCDRPNPNTPVFLNMCELSRDFAAYRGKDVAVRGIYYQGLRQTCPQSCAYGPWPSFVELSADRLPQPGEPPVAFTTDMQSWAGLENVQRAVEGEAKQGKRLEIWVTVLGQLQAKPARSRLGPCDFVANHGGYGHLGFAPAQIVVKTFTNIEVVPNATSPYDYSRIYRGAL